VRIVKKIKYAYDTGIITQVSRKDKGPYGRPSQLGISTWRGRGTSKQSRQQSTDGVAVLRQDFEEKSVSSKLIVRAYSI